MFTQIQTIVSKIDMRLGFMYGLIGKRACWSYFCYMSMGVREWLRWWVAFLGGLLLCQERYWALQEYAHFGLYNRQITKLSEWPMLEWTLSTTFTALLCTMVKSVFFLKLVIWKESIESSYLFQIQILRLLVLWCLESLFSCKFFSSISRLFETTLESGIDVGQGISIGPGKFV